MRIILKFIFLIFILLLLFVAYLSYFGIETTKFNKQIQNKIEEINKDISVELKEIKLTLNPLSYNFSAKTIGPKMIIKNQSIQMESIKTNIPLKSLLSNQFFIEETGVYKLDKNFLEQLGINVNQIDPRKIRIYGSGGNMLSMLNSIENIIEPMRISSVSHSIAIL